MLRHLLLDLDGTILGVRMETFLPAMVASMQRHFARAVPEETFTRGLQRGIGAMVANREPGRTVLEAFLEVFTGLTAVPRPEAESLFESFYLGPFRELKTLSARIAGVPELLAAVTGNGLRVTLATNPIFPLPAIRERLSWADLSAETFPLITAAEVMHYCKPAPDYYREILEMLGADAGECLMAGNDLDQDLAAKDIGIGTFLVNEGYVGGRDGRQPPDFRGSLADLAKLLDGNPSPPCGISGARGRLSTGP